LQHYCRYRSQIGSSPVPFISVDESCELR